MSCTHRSVASGSGQGSGVLTHLATYGNACPHAQHTPPSTRMHVCTHARTHACMDVRACARAHTHTRMHAHTVTHTHTHTCTHTVPPPHTLSHEKQGIKLGVSSRGWASLRTDPEAKCVYVDDDFELITFDFVTEPSTKGAYLVPIVRQYRKPLPDQAKCVHVAHLGHGVVSMCNVPRLPDVRTLVGRINELQRLVRACVYCMTCVCMLHNVRVCVCVCVCCTMCVCVCGGVYMGLGAANGRSTWWQPPTFELPAAPAHPHSPLPRPQPSHRASKGTACSPS